MICFPGFSIAAKHILPSLVEKMNKGNAQRMDPRLSKPSYHLIDVFCVKEQNKKSLYWVLPPFGHLSPSLSDADTHAHTLTTNLINSSICSMQRHECNRFVPACDAAAFEEMTWWLRPLYHCVGSPLGINRRLSWLNSVHSIAGL